MNKAIFIFTKYPSSFIVHVSNLEELSVDHIKMIEEFVNQRNGVFDFNSYTFAIKKKLEYDEFISLVKNSGLNAVCKQKILKIKQEAKIEFGKYKGMSYSDIPDSYLLWLKSSYRGKDRDIVDAELNRRTM